MSSAEEQIVEYFEDSIRGNPDIAGISALTHWSDTRISAVVARAGDRTIDVANKAESIIDEYLLDLEKSVFGDAALKEINALKNDSVIEDLEVLASSMNDGLEDIQALCYNSVSNCGSEIAALESCIKGIASSKTDNSNVTPNITSLMDMYGNAMSMMQDVVGRKAVEVAQAVRNCLRSMTLSKHLTDIVAVTATSLPAKIAIQSVAPGLNLEKISQMAGFLNKVAAAGSSEVMQRNISSKNFSNGYTAINKANIEGSASLVNSSNPMPESVSKQFSQLPPVTDQRKEYLKTRIDAINNAVTKDATTVEVSQVNSHKRPRKETSDNDRLRLLRSGRVTAR